MSALRQVSILMCQKSRKMIAWHSGSLVDVQEIPTTFRTLKNLFR
jgi:hypothetical protein